MLLITSLAEELLASQQGLHFVELDCWLGLGCVGSVGSSVRWSVGLLNAIIPYLLTPWSGALLEKLTSKLCS